MWMWSPTRAPPVLRGAVELLWAPVFDRSARALLRARTPLPRTGAHRRSVGSAGGGLAAQPQPLDERAVALHVFVFQVAEQPTTTTDELEKATLGVEVVLVGLHVLGEVVDAAGQQCDLDLGRSGVTGAGAVLVDDLLLDGGVERQRNLLRFIRPRGLHHKGRRDLLACYLRQCSGPEPGRVRLSICRVADTSSAICANRSSTESKRTIPRSRSVNSTATISS